jgi:hypothetical protein
MPDVVATQRQLISSDEEERQRFGCDTEIHYQLGSSVQTQEVEG